MSSYQKKKASERKLHDDITATQENNSLETVRSRMDLLTLWLLSALLRALPNKVYILSQNRLQKAPHFVKWHFMFLIWSCLSYDSMGAFHSTQNSGNFDCYIKWNGPFRLGPTGIFGTSFEGGPLWSVWSFRSVGLKCSFPFDKIVVPSTALLYPACKNNNQARDGLGRVCATGIYRSIEHVKLPKFQTGIFVERKAPHFNQFFAILD